MSIQRLARAAAATSLFTLAWTGLAVAQQQQPQQQQQPPENAQELLQELQQIQQRLGEIEERALQEEPQLQERRAEVVGMVEDAMLEMNPEIDTKIERFEELETEFSEAQSSGDQQRLQALAMEAQQIQGELQQAQSAAMEREDVAAELEMFRTQLISKMQEVDPETEQLMARMEAIGQELSGGAG